MFFFQAEYGIRDLVRSRGLGDVYNRQPEMIDDIRDELTGETVRECIATIHGSLDRDATGIWHLDGHGRDAFGLRGENLREFMMRCIRALLDHGAIPVTLSLIHICRCRQAI